MGGVDIIVGKAFITSKFKIVVIFGSVRLLKATSI